jgi:flagellar basal body-associated protein FliL
MADEAQKKQQRSNKKYFLIMLIISLLVTAFSAAMTFHFRPKKKQNTFAFLAGTTVTTVGMIYVWDRIKVRKVIAGNKIKYITTTDLRRGLRILLTFVNVIDVIGIGIVVQFIGI